MRTLGIILIALSLIGCATAPIPNIPVSQSQSDTLWPKIYQNENYLFDFSSSLSDEAAVGAIKNLQNSMVEHSANLAFTSLDVDAFGMRARWSWVEGGTVVKSAGFIIPYDQVSMILLQHYPSLEKSFRWGLNVYIKGSSTVSIRTPARDSAERLGKAIHALARARGAEITIPNPRFGAAVAPLSEAQAKAAGISWPGGLIISWVFRDSRAERAGFSAQDIITNVAGSAVFKGEDLFARLDKAEKIGDKNIKIQGLRRSYRLEADKYIEIFVPLTYVLPIDTPQGGSK